MNLWISTHFLVAGLFLSSWALTPEECRPLITPLSMKPSMLFGKSHFLVGYTDNEVYNDMLKTTQSYWMNVHPSPSIPETFAMSADNKLNGTCLSLRTNINFEGNTASTLVSNITSVFHILPTCDGCLLMSINSSATNLDKVFSMMNYNSKHSSCFVVLSPARGTTLKDSDLEHFRKQASCLGFNREPDFIYDPKNDFCAEGEGRMLFE
uniref:Uncharacterized protein n=1 Tax=Cyclopterus lumpus TaxID=8103 RepID=A0A8C2XFY7_CYCLU